MRAAIGCLLVLLPAVGAAAEALHATPFPLPQIDGKRLVVTAGQTTFNVPLKLSKVESFYREQLKQEPKITFKAAGAEGARTLTIESKRIGDAWAKAVLKEGEVATSITVTFIITPKKPEEISGTMPPVLFIPRSADAARDADAIDHLEHPKK
jgi:hypothetical protein